MYADISLDSIWIKALAGVALGVLAIRVLHRERILEEISPATEPGGEARPGV